MSMSMRLESGRLQNIDLEDRIQSLVTIHIHETQEDELVADEIDGWYYPWERYLINGSFK